LLRTKAASSDEGGVAAGYAVLDSPYLVWSVNEWIIFSPYVYTYK
jgi:hypothetical protein